jgi:hypothetical protein
MLASSREANGPIWRKSRPRLRKSSRILILLAPPDERTALMAVLPANLGRIVLEKSQESDPTTLCAVRVAVGGRRSRSRENALMALDNVPRPSHVLTVGS